MVNKINVIIEDGAKLPERAHDRDAGWDLFSFENAHVYPGETIRVTTGVHFEIPKGYVGFIKTKSGLCKIGLQTEGVVDSGYTGEVMVVIKNLSNNIYIVEKGAKIAQIVFLPILDLESLEVVDKFAEYERGDNGFGSTGL